MFCTNSYGMEFCFTNLFRQAGIFCLNLQQSGTAYNKFQFFVVHHTKYFPKQQNFSYYS